MERKFGDLKTRVAFYHFEPTDGPEQGEEEKKLHQCWAQIDGVWLKDLEQAKANGTLEDLTIVIRDTRGEYIPNNKHYVSIESPGYLTKRFNVKSVQPDLQDKRFLIIVAGMTT